MSKSEWTESKVSLQPWLIISPFFSKNKDYQYRYQHHLKSRDELSCLLFIVLPEGVRESLSISLTPPKRDLGGKIGEKDSTFAEPKEQMGGRQRTKL